MHFGGQKKSGRREEVIKPIDYKGILYLRITWGKLAGLALHRHTHKKLCWGWKVMWSFGAVLTKKMMSWFVGLL
jgi:hypothetical protein